MWKPCSTKSAFHESATSVAASGDAMHWLLITECGPYPQRSVASPRPGTIKSQLTTCSPRDAVHNELKTKSGSVVRFR